MWAVTVVVTVRNEDGVRSGLNMRLDVRVKAEYERAIREKFGVIRPYAGVELERECAALVGDGRLADLFDAVHRLSDALGETTREKKTQTPPRSESVMCRYRIRETVREDVMALADEADVTYPRDLVERVMWDYAQDRSAVDKAVDRMGRIRDKAETELGASDSTTERRTLTIVNALTDENRFGGGDSFTLEQFDGAVDQDVQGISSGSYARQQYLPRVLNEMEYTWHPKNSQVFVSEFEKFVPDERDARTKPYVLMDRKDKREAIRRDAVETAAEKTSTRKTKYRVEDGVSALEGRPNHQTVEQLLRALANTDERFTWDDTDGVALVTGETKSSGGGAGDVSAEWDQLSNATTAREQK